MNQNSTENLRKKYLLNYRQVLICSTKISSLFHQNFVHCKLTIDDTNFDNETLLTELFKTRGKNLAFYLLELCCLKILFGLSSAPCCKRN